MILGLGSDIVEIERIAALLDSRLGGRFRQRLFTKAERTYCESKGVAKAASYAARFAAKEAVAKALGEGIGKAAHFADIEVIKVAHGRPEVMLRGAALATAERLGVRRVWLSLSHTEHVAMAHAVLEG